MEKWLDKLQDGAQFDGLTNQGFNYNPNWGGSFQEGGIISANNLSNTKERILGEGRPSPRYYDIIDTNPQNFGGGITTTKFDLDQKEELPYLGLGWNREVVPRYDKRDYESLPYYKPTQEEQNIINKETSFNKDWVQGRRNTFDKEGNPVPVEENIFNKYQGINPSIRYLQGKLGELNPNTKHASLDPSFVKNPGTVTHEDWHQYQDVLSNQNIKKYINDPVELSRKDSNNRSTEKQGSQYKYMKDPAEIHGFIQELRYNNKLKPDQFIDDETMKNLKFSHDNLLPEYYDKNTIKNFLNSMVSNQPTSVNNNLAKDGNIIKDDNGYWDPNNWGNPVEIDNNNITMKGVYEPLVGISNTGDKKFMEPGKDYKFKGSKVTEYPLVKNGKELINFTKHKKTNWLDNL